MFRSQFKERILLPCCNVILQPACVVALFLKCAVAMHQKPTIYFIPLGDSRVQPH